MFKKEYKYILHFSNALNVPLEVLHLCADGTVYYLAHEQTRNQLAGTITLFCVSFPQE
jgi:hypothetical protein